LAFGLPEGVLVATAGFVVLDTLTLRLSTGLVVTAAATLAVVSALEAAGPMMDPLFGGPARFATTLLTLVGAMELAMFVVAPAGEPVTDHLTASPAIAAGVLFLVVAALAAFGAPFVLELVGLGVAVATLWLALAAWDPAVVDRCRVEGYQLLFAIVAVPLFALTRAITRRR
jgi:hypothetical protein